MNTVIVDDEFKAIELLRGYSSQVPFIHVDKTFRSALEALPYIQKNTTDLLLLDINMPGLSGLDFLKTIETKPIVVLTTAYSEHALDGYEFDIADYLLKPITFGRFLKAVSKAHKLFTNSTIGPMSVFVKSGTRLHQIDISDVDYLEKDGNYVIFHCGGKKIMSRMSTSEVLGMLPARNFLQIHKSYIVSRSKIGIADPHEVVTRSGAHLPIGDSYREEFFRQLKG